MNGITKLYENAGIKPYIYCSKPQLDCDARETGNCKQDCEYYSGERLLTPFTAEKQIELIKLLGSIRDYTIEIDKFKGVYYVGCRSAGSNDKLWGSSNIFEDALAELINETWFCLTEEEKQQVKGILE